MSEHEIVERDDRSIEEVFVSRVGKVEALETYSNSTEFLLLFPNDYSVIVKEQTRKHASVNIFYGISEVTNHFFKTKRGNRKVKAKLVQNLINHLEHLEAGEHMKKKDE